MALVARPSSAPEAIKRPKFSPERPGGFRKKPTFQELAKDKPPPREQPIRRDATEYWNSFEGAWLRGPIDDIRDKANEIQTREAIRLLAEKQAKNLNIPVPAIIGDLKRQFQRPDLIIGNPDSLQRETVFPTEGRAALDELLNKNYANPAAPNGVTESQDAKRQNDILEQLLKLNKQQRHRAEATSEFSKASVARGAMRAAMGAGVGADNRFANMFMKFASAAGLFDEPAPAPAEAPAPPPPPPPPPPPTDDERRARQAEKDAVAAEAANRRRRTLPERPPANPNPAGRQPPPPQTRITSLRGRFPRRARTTTTTTRMYGAADDEMR